MRQLSARDSAYVYLGDAHRSAMVLSCWVVARPDRGPSGLTDSVVVDLAARFAEQEMFSTVLRRLPLDIGHPYWVHVPGADLTRHIRFYPAQGRTWSDVQEMLADVMDTPFDITRPLWTVQIIADVAGLPGREGLATVVAITHHHAAFDGISWQRFVYGTLSDQQVDADAVTAPPIGPDDRGVAALVAREMFAAPLIWLRFTVAVARSLIEHRGARGRGEAGRIAPPVTRFNRTPRGRSRADYLEIPVDDAIAMKATVAGATTNDVVLSIIGGAMRRYLEAHGEPPASSLAALMPMSVRGRTAATTDNQFVSLIVDLHTHVDDIACRIRRLAEHTAREKASARARVDDHRFRAANSTPAPLLALAGALARRGTSTVPRTARYSTTISTVFNRVPVESVVGLPAVSGFGFAPLGEDVSIAHSVVSGYGTVRILVTVAEDVVTDLAVYMQLLRESVDHHRLALLGCPDLDTPDLDTPDARPSHIDDTGDAA